jgi:predicted HTH domain antitoxin
MNLTVEVPDDLVGRLTAAGGDLSRRALEALALEENKSGHVTKGELRRLLGFSTRCELDEFLKAHEAWADYTIEDLHRELQDLQNLGL